jgi:hypothetical protein
MQSRSGSLRWALGALPIVLLACNPDHDGDGISAKDGDCNDLDAATFPGALEVCDFVDQNCNGQTDENPEDGETYYVDDDDDGFGDEDRDVEACARPDGYAALDDDCDDEASKVHPDADDDELNGVDDNCDGEIDDGVPLDLESVLPGGGPVTGGTEVTLRGGPFNDDTTVTFDGTPGEVLEVDEDVMLVRIPAVSQDGVVDLVVQRYEKAATIDFIYFADGAGLSGLSGTFQYFYLNGTYWTDETPFTYMFLALTEPWNTPMEELFWGTTLDTCVAGGQGVLLVDIPWVGSPPPDLRFRGSTSFDVPGDADFPAMYRGEGAFAAGTSLSMLSNPAPGWPAFEVANLARIPASFTLTAPAMNGSSLGEVAQGFTVTWTGGAPATYVGLNIRINDSDSEVDRVTCLVRDDGSFAVPSSAFTDWAPGRILYLDVSRVDVSAAVLPYNGSTADVGGAYTIVGAAFTE